MRLPHFEHLKPASLQECLAALAESGDEAGLMAGGTDLLCNMKFGVIKPRKVVSIGSIPELCQVSEDGDGNLQIGACATLSDLVQNPLLSASFPALHDAIKSVGSVHVRNMATIGGNICLAPRCWYYNQSQQWRRALTACHREGGIECHAIGGAQRCHAINSSDTAPVLMALDAQVCLRRKDGERWLPLRNFFRDDGNRHTVLEAGEMLTCIVIPKGSAKHRSLFIKVQLRRGLDFAIGSVGASLGGNGQGKEITLVMNSLCSAPLILAKAAQAIMEEGLNDAAIAKAATAARGELGTVTNLFTSAGYKRQIVEVLVKRALTELKTDVVARRKPH